MSSLLRRYISHMGRKLSVEELPDDFSVYIAPKDKSSSPKTIPACRAFTDCCDARPVKYFDNTQDNSTWWLICPKCKSAIKANGSGVL